MCYALSFFCFIRWIFSYNFIVSFNIWVSAPIFFVFN